MIAIYPNLAGEIAKRGIKKSAIARQIGVSEKTLYNKMSGEAEFTWPEVLSINSCFFPDMETKTLFQKSTNAHDRPGA